jgi:hypothetical protein
VGKQLCSTEILFDFGCAAEGFDNGFWAKAFDFGLLYDFFGVSTMCSGDVATWFFQGRPQTGVILIDNDRQAPVGRAQSCGLSMPIYAVIHSI